MSKCNLLNKLKQFFCYHHYADANLKVRANGDSVVYSNRCVKCGKEWESKVPKKAIFGEIDDG